MIHRTHDTKLRRIVSRFRDTGDYYRWLLKTPDTEIERLSEGDQVILHTILAAKRDAEALQPRHHDGRIIVT